MTTVMKNLALSALVLTGVVALPASEARAVVPAWYAPGWGDVRSPCPLLNSLANHNFIPHDGKNLTIPLLTKAFKDYINTGADVAQTLGATADTTNPIPDATFFNLNDIDKHGVIEHDGSLSRNDVFFGNDHSFNPLIYDGVKAYFVEDVIDFTTAANARLNRMTVAKLVNPAFNISSAAFAASFVESSFYLSVFGDPVKGNANPDWVNVFFQEERLPYAEGWTPRQQETNLTTLTAMAAKIQAVTPAVATPAPIYF